MKRGGTGVVEKYRDPILKFTHQGLMFQSVDSKIYSERGRFVQSGTLIIGISIAQRISSVDLTRYTNTCEL